MTVLYRPLPDAGAPIDAPRIAGGWLRFSAVEMLERGRAPVTLPVSEVPAGQLATLSDRRPAIAGIAMDRPSIMGILNVTPDSFSDGGRYLDREQALTRARALAQADILDIGGESTRPGAQEVPEDEEAARVVPVIAALSGRCMSIDTRKASVARAATGAGAALINDVSAMTFDPGMADTVATSGAAVCLMHAQGAPETMQDDPTYGDVLFDVYDALSTRIEVAVAAGIPRDSIMIDPGIGFGKTQAHNLSLLRRIGVFHGLGVPILLGVSRKRFIGDIGGAQQADARLPGTLAVTLAAVAQGIQMHRVHDVAEIAQGLALWRAVQTAD
ncbi:dihydropteroate synthase [Jannaschia sp. 2305UL9-9]|uniref:dihydropteroate synthase n=1 Tax=Jannaschia sp. 2305UL9-9 TaxID=3121638 RepID=UPI003526FB17